MIYRVVLTVRVRDDPDYIKPLAPVGMVSGLEVWFGIIIACIPTLAPVFKVTMNTLKSTLSRSTPSTNSSATPMPLRILGSNDRHRTYDQIESDSQTRLQPSRDEQTHDLENQVGVITRVTHDPPGFRRQALDPKVIHVKRQVETDG